MFGLSKTRPRHFVNPVTLGAFAVMSAVYGTSYIAADAMNYDGESLQLATLRDAFLPTFVYGTMWVLIAGACVVGLFSRRAFRVGFSSFVAACAGWSLLYLTLWINEPSSFGLFSSSMWWATVTIASYTIVVAELTAVKKIAHENGLEDNEVR